jgi:hypothetical protein
MFITPNHTVPTRIDASLRLLMLSHAALLAVRFAAASPQHLPTSQYVLVPAFFR